MGRRYKSPTVYRDKRCPHCGLHFTARGLNGHIRFYHGQYESAQIQELGKKFLWMCVKLYIKGHHELAGLINTLETQKYGSLRELRESYETIRMTYVAELTDD